MNTDAVKTFCRALPGCSETLVGSPGNVLRFTLQDKPFAYFKTSQPEQWRFSFRASAERFLELTAQPGIKPARYMQRWRWVTVVEVERLPDDDLKALILESYRQVIQGLSKRRQGELALL
ncbi:MAG: MmcQ/YjbR family DNA-binding protein [Pseudomonadota bacterium]